ncbi:reverse transcriptase domain-containing protein [Vibrio breoganii]
MGVQQRFEKHFSVDNLKRIFKENVALSGATGIDNLDPATFRHQLDEQLGILSRKATAGTYQFSKYKLKLITKGRGKAPREISIPTVRDRVALRALNDFLSESFDSAVDFKLPQNVISEVKTELDSSKYDGFIKLDVTQFYPSIEHLELLSRLRKRIKSEHILDFIQSAISSPTVSRSNKNDKKETKGVPQGLAVSNVLAAIYMINIDRYCKKNTGIRYFRYVDDILILCDFREAEKIGSSITKRFKKIGLHVHPILPSSDKSVIGRIGQPFSYLGYYFKGSVLTARQGTVDRLKDSLAAIFTANKYSKYKNEEFLLWRLDMRITGCIFEKKSKGWLFFFSMINDEKLLHELDSYINKLTQRFAISGSPKRFSRAFKELTHNRYQTNYIPNFDEYNQNQKLELLNRYFPKDVQGKQLTSQQIEYHFRKRLKKQTKDLLEDIKNFRS